MRLSALLSLLVVALALSSCLVSARSFRQRVHDRATAERLELATVKHEIERLSTDAQVQTDANAIIDVLVNGALKGVTWDRLSVKNWSKIALDHMKSIHQI
jgi:hypothetical protein